MKKLLTIFTVAVFSSLTTALMLSIWPICAVLFLNSDAQIMLVPSLLSGALLALRLFIRTLHRTQKLWQCTLLCAGAALVWVVSSRFHPFGLPLNDLWGLSGTAISFGIMGRLIYLLPVSLDDWTPTVLTRAFLWALRSFGYAFFIALVFLPFYFLIITSTKPRASILNNPLDLRMNLERGLPALLTGYREILTKFRFSRYIINSFIVSVFSVIFTLIPAISGAYAVTRLRFKGRDFFSKLILLVYLFPTIVVVIPLYGILSQLGIRNTLFGLIVVYPAMTIPVALYMLRSYFFTLPQSIEEAGLIDGCSRTEVIFRITIPLSIPAIASVALYIFIIVWNEFLFSFMLIDSPRLFTLSRGIATLNSQEVPRQFLMAGSVLITLPAMLLVSWLQRMIVGGLTSGGVKS